MLKSPTCILLAVTKNIHLFIQVALSNNLSGSPSSLPAIDIDTEGAQQKRKELLESQLQERVKFNLKQDRDKALLDQEAEEEKHRTLLSLEEQSFKQMQQAIKKKELEFQKELAEKQSLISVKESDRLIEAHQREMEAMKAQLEDEKQQQKQV